MDDVDVRPVNRLYSRGPRDNLNGHRAINPRDGDPVAGGDGIHEVVVSVHDDGVGRLSCGHVVRRLLQLDHLLVRVVAAIVNQAEAEAVVAVGADGGLAYATAVDLHHTRQGAHDALEEGLAHLGNDVGRSNDHARDGDQLIDVLGIQAAHALGSGNIEGSHLDLVIQHSCGILFEEHLVDSHVHGGDDLLGIADQLFVEVFVEGLQVSAIDVHVGLLQGMDLVEFLHVQGIGDVHAFGHLVVFGFWIDETLNESLELLLAAIDHNVGAPYYQLGSGQVFTLG